MAIQPLFDVSEIDLNQVAISADEVGSLNPQAGDMRQLDHVIWHSGDWQEFLGIKHVRDDEFWVPGHIPGRPLLPGVLMIEAAAQLASVSFRLKTKENRFLAFTRVSDVAFRAQVVPGDDLLLLTKELEFKPRRFVAIAQGWVGDSMAFEGRITGMVVRDDQGRT